MGGISIKGYVSYVHIIKYVLLFFRGHSSSLFISLHFFSSLAPKSLRYLGLIRSLTVPGGLSVPGIFFFFFFFR